MSFPLISTKRYDYRQSAFATKPYEPFRSPFLTDYDRIIFSNPFRRLSKKTQVHPLAKNDHVHNRLTHSLEVASVGRTLGLGVGHYLKIHGLLDPYNPYDVAAIVQSACLAHDIGNPPFGHAGEEIIKEWFAAHAKDEVLTKALTPKQLEDFLSFDGNAQSFRIVSQLENHAYNGGMCLTMTTLATMIKYPWAAYDERSKRQKFNFFQSEEKIAQRLFEEFGLLDEGVALRHPFSYLMEAADDICYALLDIKDAVELKMLTAEQLSYIFKPLCGDEFQRTMNEAQMDDYEKISRLCAIAIGNLTNHALDVYLQHHLYIPQKGVKDLISLFGNREYQEALAAAKKLGHDYIFNEPRKIELEMGAYNTLGIVLDSLIQAAYELHEGKGLSFKSGHALKLLGSWGPTKEQSLYEKYQSVLDYIVGMTDNYATRLAGQLSGMGR